MHAPDSITYVYECNRLKEIHYPGHPENDVTYVYGTKTDTGATKGFRAGRLKYLIDGSGAREYTYGRMGEVTQERRTLIIPNQAVATYVTGWTYDAWNRVRTMTYPDGEQLTYQYNPGGLLRAINGVKDNQQYTYIHTINYDKFERRTSIRYGNNVVTE
ncbi:MAG TPA: type IV secretion protein Rhs, partial [Bacteroidales bacterium]|nr:type IV secretion protein Rhs [Bacteroidales bacterium]